MVNGYRCKLRTPMVHSWRCTVADDTREPFSVRRLATTSRFKVNMGAIARALEVIAELWLPAVILLVVLTLILGVKRIWTVLGLVAVCLFAIAAYQRVATTPADDSDVTWSPSSTPASAIDTVGVAQAQIEGLQIIGATAPWEFSGTVINRAPEHTLLSATIRITRRDCFEGALDPSGCVVLWEGSKRVNLSVPPGEQQKFVESVSPRGSVPRAQGMIKDEFVLAGLTGRRVERAAAPKPNGG
jgi:hypothetical protein